MCHPKHVEQFRNTGIINSTTRSHLGGSFFEKVFIIKCEEEATSLSLRRSFYSGPRGMRVVPAFPT
jgi:hypothetical protein